MDKREKQIIFRLTDLEKDFLREKGGGNMQKGLSRILAETGFNPDMSPSGEKGKYLIRRQTTFDKDEYLYMLLRDGHILASFAIKFDIQRGLLARMNKSKFYEEVIIKSLLQATLDENIQSQITSIVDLDTGKLIWREDGGASESSEVIQEYLNLFDNLIKLMKNAEAENSTIDKGKMEYILDEMKVLAKREPKITPQLKNINFYEEICREYFSKNISRYIREELIVKIKHERKSLEKFAIEHNL